jgi:Flp pilus assembly protein TadD
MRVFICMTFATAMAIMAGGCRYFDIEEPLVAEPKGDAAAASTFGAAPEQVWLVKAKENFRNGEYGLAERYFRRAVEERYNNVEAWIGLAAAYDRLKRFDEADRAYQIVVKMAGSTPAVLNNLGYHHMLKGEFAAAEHILRAAERADPANPQIQTNLRLLDEWKANAGRSG